MNKISSKALLIIGLTVKFGNPVLIVFTALLFPNMPGEVAMPLSIFFDCLGIVILTLSLAKKRLENGKIKAESAFRALTALTPSQICLIISMALIVIGEIISAIGISFFGWISVIGIYGIFASIILAIVRAVIIRRKCKVMAAFFKVDHTTVSSGIQHKPKGQCERCGCDLHLIRKDQITSINGKLYCDVCTEYLKKLSSAQKYNCVVCKRSIPSHEMTSIWGKKICNECVSKYWAGKLPELIFRPEDKELLMEAEKKRLALEQLYHTKCFSCSVEHPKSVFHLIDGKYYCEECFSRMFPFDI